MCRLEVEARGILMSSHPVAAGGWQRGLRTLLDCVILSTRSSATWER